MMTEPLKLTVTFKNSNITAHTLELLSKDSEAIIFSYFREKFFELEGLAKKPFAYPEDQFRSTILNLAKKAFDQHRSAPYPGDDVQQVMAKIDHIAELSLTGDFGPTTAKHIHPVITFT